jgi:hypothetical protein
MSLIAHTLTNPAEPQLTMKITVPKRDEFDRAHTHETRNSPSGKLQRGYSQENLVT